MAYSNVGTPVFYVDNYLYHKTIGTYMSTNLSGLSEDGYEDDGVVYSPADAITPNTTPDLYTLKPSVSKVVSEDYGEHPGISIHSPRVLNNDLLGFDDDATNPANGYDFSGNMKYYIALLNHNFGYNDGDDAPIRIGSYNGSDDVYTTFDVYGVFTDILNSRIDVQYGSSIFEFQDIQFWEQQNALFDDFISATESRKNHMMIKFRGSRIGAVSSGIKYTMPHSPDLKLSMEIEFDGVDTITTSGGASISNVRYTGNPLWVNGLPDFAWEFKTNPFETFAPLANFDTAVNAEQYSAGRRNGRKSWSLKFSYMNDRDLFSSNIKADTYSDHESDGTIADHYNTGDIEDDKLYFNIETDDSFYAQVWNKTLGGALPFIFQPDSNFRDEFYICKFDQDSLKISQSAYKVYDISVKIVEVW